MIGSTSQSSAMSTTGHGDDCDQIVEVDEGTTYTMAYQYTVT